MLESLPKEVFSSFRIVYVAYVVLIFFGKFENKITLTDFFITSGMLMILVIIHDDYLRIVFNRWGERDGKNSLYIIIPVIVLLLGYLFGRIS